MANAELFSPLAWPMLIPPKDWSNTSAGGYMLNELMQGHDLVRRGDPSRIQGEIPIAFLNKIQQVKYRLKPFHSQCRYAVRRQGNKCRKSFSQIIKLRAATKAIRHSREQRIP